MNARRSPRRYGSFHPETSSHYHDLVAGGDTNAFHEWTDWADEHDHPAVADAMRTVQPYEHASEYVFGRMPKAGFLYATSPALEHPKPEWNGQGATLTLLHQNEHGHHLSWPVRGKTEEIAALAKRLDGESVPRLTARPTTQSSMDIFRRMTPAQRQYVDTALWSSHNDRDAWEGDEGESLDRNHGITDLHPQTLARMIAEWESFKAHEHKNLEDFPDPVAAHNFWLSRGGYGSGFLDSDHPDADNLQRAAQAHRETNLYVGDDGQIHQDNEWAPLLRHAEPSERRPVQEQRRLAATRAPAGGMIVREGFRSATPGATYHGGLFYKGGKMLPSVSGGLPKVKRHNPQARGQKPEVRGQQTQQQPAAQQFNRGQRRYAANSSDNADGKTPFQHPRLSERTNTLLRLNHHVVMEEPNDHEAHQTYAGTLGDARRELQRAFRVPVGDDAKSVKAHTALNDAEERRNWHSRMSDALRRGYQRDSGLEHWMRGIIRDPNDETRRLAMAEYLEEYGHKLPGFQDKPELVQPLVDLIRTDVEAHRLGESDGGAAMRAKAAKISRTPELQEAARRSGIAHLFRASGDVLITKFGPRLYRRPHRYAAIPNAHYLHAIMSTGRWEPFLGWAHRLEQSGNPAIASVLRAHHAFAMAHPHMKPGFYGPEGSIGHWPEGMHPEGFSFESNPDTVGRDVGHVRLRHTLSPTQTRSWFFRGGPEEVESMASRLRVEGVPEFTTGKFVHRTPREALGHDPIPAGPIREISPNQKTSPAIAPRKKSAARRPRAGVRNQGSVKQKGSAETYRPSPTLLQMCRG